MYDFATLIEQAKEARSKLQGSQVPFLPPGLVLTWDGEPKASAICGKPDEVTLAGMLAMIPALGADGCFLTFEGYVRPSENETPGPIADDPLAAPAVICLYATKAGAVSTSLNPYFIDDAGNLVWSTPGPVSSPAVPKLVDALKELFVIEIEGKAVAREVCDWLAINGYGLQIHPSLIPEDE